MSAVFGHFIHAYLTRVAPVRMQQLGKRQADRCIAPGIRDMRQSIIASHTTQLSYLLPYLKYKVLLVPTSLATPDLRTVSDPLTHTCRQRRGQRPF